jgi:hypothetical protein
MVNFKAGQRDTYGTTDEKLVVAQPEAFVTCAVGGGCGKWDYAVGYTWPYGLNYMGEAPYWKLIGATIQHGNTNLVNHWLQQHANWGLWYAITNYLARNPDQGKVALNDQSLPCGGLFDISGRWQFPHRSHNLGLSADIRGNGGEYSLPRANNSAKQWEFVQLCIDRGGADPNQSTVEDIGTVNQHVHCRW